MRGYDRHEYEDLDEYEEEGEEQEEEDGEDEEEEVRLPTKEELEYLELRQRLKESIRKQMKKESGSVLSNSREKKSKMPNDTFGSFFGPSQPVIAQRVIEESKSLLENPHLAARVSKGNSSKNKGYASTTPVRSKPRANNCLPDVSNRLKTKTKIQMVKNTRDYSFLLSDDAELPAPAKDLPPRSVSVPKSEAQLAHRTPSSNGRKVPSGREERKPLPAVSQMRAKVGPQKPAISSRPNSGSVDPRQQLGRNNASGPGRPSVPKGLPSKSLMPTKDKVISAPGAKSSMPGVRKPLPAKSQSSVPKQLLEQKKDYRESNQKMIAKRPIITSKPQIKQHPAKSSARPTLQEQRPKKRPARPYYDDEDDDGAAISMIRNMFRYNPNKYRDDDDDSDMEANFEDIMKEERRSAKIAKKEDEEELRKIEEEERRERMRKEAKKRKLSR